MNPKTDEKLTEPGSEPYRPHHYITSFVSDQPSNPFAFSVWMGIRFFELTC
jgi:hypothetical protein